MQSPIESQQARVLLQLRDLILKGVFGPGERLAEIPLAERLQTSRTPVRLALGTLEYEGLIEPCVSGGYQMRGYTAKDVVDAIRSRGVLEGFAARTLAEQGASRSLLRALQDCRSPRPARCCPCSRRSPKARTGCSWPTSSTTAWCRP